MKLRDFLPRTQEPTETASNDVSYVFAIGEIDGKILDAYRRIFDKEKELGIIASWIICPGSMGIWPDFKHVDRATRTHSDVGDFYKLYYEQWTAPRNMLFISGAHEDHLWLNRKWKTKDTQLLGNFWYLNNGYQTTIGPTITGLGKVYSPNAYEGIQHPKNLKYYTRKEIEKACSIGPTDILLSHQGPLGEVFGNKKSNSEGIKSIIYATRPKIVIHSGYGFSKTYDCLNTRCISLDKMEIVVLKWDYKLKNLTII